MDLTHRLARHLRDLRRERGWTLDGLAARSGVSRATLSRIETAAVSPATDVLARVAAAYRLPVSRLLALAEDGFAALVRYKDQAEWEDNETGLARRIVSPPAAGLAAEVQECHLPPDTAVGEPAPARSGREHHLVLLDGALRVGLGPVAHDLTGGDCLRFHPTGPVAFATGPARGARYLLIRV